MNYSFSDKGNFLIALCAAIDSFRESKDADVVVTQQMLASHFRLSRQRINQLILKHGMQSFILSYSSQQVIKTLEKMDVSEYTTFRLKRVLNYKFSAKHLWKILELKKIPYKKTLSQKLHCGEMTIDEYELIQRKKKIKKKLSKIRYSNNGYKKNDNHILQNKEVSQSWKKRRSLYINTLS